MKKFLKKSDSGGDDDPSRGSLFGSRKNKSSSSDSNPYAQQPSEDPYANSNPNPYAAPSAPRSSSGLPSGPRGGGGGGLPGGPGPRSGYGTPPPPYGGRSSGGPAPGGAGGAGYGNEKVGAAGGYGGNRYDSNDSYGGGGAPSRPSTGARGPGGYGGLGRTDSDDSNRNDLFSGAQGRAAQRQNDYTQGASGAGGYGQSGAGGGYGGSAGGDGGYGGGYGEERMLTEEEREERDLQSTKDEINAVRQESAASTERSLQAGLAALETMQSSYARLGVQREKLANTEKNLDLADNHNRIADERTRELATLNRSMFAVHIGNPFTKSQRMADKDAKVLERHRLEREVRENTRRDAFQSQSRIESGMGQIGGGRGSGQRGPLGGAAAARAANRSKFTFEDDDGEQDAVEQRIDDNLDQLSGIVSQLNQGARMMGEEVDSQNKLIERIGVKSDAVDDGVRMNREKLSRIR